jgi:hypothetical protein
VITDEAGNRIETIERVEDCDERILELTERANDARAEADNAHRLGLEGPSGTALTAAERIEGEIATLRERARVERSRRDIRRSSCAPSKANPARAARSGRSFSRRTAISTSVSI